jgi:integrase/recombinase XerD
VAILLLLLQFRHVPAGQLWLWTCHRARSHCASVGSARSIAADRKSALHLHGKGRKERVDPLLKTTAVQLPAWSPRIDSSPLAPVVVNRAGALTSRSGVKYILSVALAVASGPCPTLTGPRSTRHTAPPQCDAPPAVRRGHHGHRSVTRSRESDHHAPFEAGLSMKEVALRHVGNPAPEPLRFNAPDRLLAILEDL